ncbi:MAG TPA: DUF4173 domain-containing protein [Verrucomicrobiae bacterium]|nr:DUF4173 domain-containing protein [Verrucomicrobiae bacterium]
MQTEPKTKLALLILAVAVVMGFLADGLLREVAWGINLTIWIGLLIGGLAIAKRVGGGILEAGSALLIAPILIFGVCFSWRDSSMLRGLDLGAIILAAALVITRQTSAFWAPSISRVVGSVFNLVAHCFAGFVHLISRDIDWTQQRSSVVAANARSAAAGVMIAIPILLVFTLLFVRADAAFENLLTQILHINIARHLVPVALGTWLAGSYLRGVLVPSTAQNHAPLKSGLELGATEINVALALVNVLFAAFVAVQLQYLFGSARMVETTPGLTYATYARRGFFELVIVALLVLPILLGADSVHAADRNKRAFRIQSLVLVGLVLCVMASAMHRMRLYQYAYGLTELRFYVVAFMIYLAVVFALFCLTVLRGWGGLFPMGTVGVGFAAILVLHVANPDQWIAKTNIRNAVAGRAADLPYLTTLSGDAVPTLLRNPQVIPTQDVISRYELRSRDHDDWRAWNYGRHSAERAILESRR